MGWSWRNKKTTCAGSVLFRGGVPPRAEEFAHLERRGFAIAPAAPTSRAAHWGLLVSHPKLGEAQVMCLRDCPRPGRQLIDLDPMLTRPERDAAYLGESTVSVVVEGERQDVLRDRKALLGFMRAVMGDDGVVAVDHTAQRFWPPEALDDEVGHDADLDIESLYTLHAVTGDDAGDDEVIWLHSHGLAEIGLFDFDVLRPSEDLLGRGRDALRAVAFAILDGVVNRNTAKFALMMPGGSVRFVDVRDFLKRGGRAGNELRPGADAEHNRDRAVLCDVAGGGWLGRLFGRRVTPSRLLSQGMPDEMMVPFSTSASNLMAERAKGTYLQFRQLAGEFAEFDFPVVVKLGYRIDGGGPEEREHLWFEVNHLHDDRIDATLASVPQAVRKLKKGQRGWHMLDLLTDWAIPTPLGTITPRYTVPARQIRGDRERFRQLMRQARRVSEAG
ncbi:MAG: hypothetical protein JWN40_4587 [Phycisphaerales bacterium]|nr:hypothetical protein [Phycisphaerales bacterium]